MADTKYETPQSGQAIAREKGGKDAPAGLWRHPNGTESITTEDPLYGNAMSQGFKRLGFEFIRPAEPGEIKTLPELHTEVTSDKAADTKGINARLDKLESETEKKDAEIAKLKAQLHAAGVEEAVEGQDDVVSHPAAQQAAEAAKANAQTSTDASEANKEPAKQAAREARTAEADAAHSEKVKAELKAKAAADKKAEAEAEKEKESK